MGACSVKESAEMPAALPTAHAAGSDAPTPLLVRTQKPKVHDGIISSSQFILQNMHKLAEVYDVNQKKLGDGTYGVVFMGKHRATGATRAIKKISKAHVKDLKGLRQEIAIMKMMDHPNIIRLFETFEDRNHIFLVMELCEGGELFDRIIEAGHLSECDSASVIRDILRAIYYMHEQDVVHRDLKPENFLLQNGGPIAGNCLKLIDFGTARKAAKRTILTTKIGTPFYIAPQVVKGRYDRQCDLWSTGAIMYTLLVGKPPFTGSTDAEIMRKVRDGRLSFKEPQWAKVSEEGKALVRKLMRMSPTDRITAEEALNHEWIKSTAPEGPKLQISEECIQVWRNYQSQNRLRKAALHIIAGQLQDKEIKRLRENFMALDADGNGQLTHDELKQGFEQAGLCRSDMDLETLLNAVDSDGSGVIDYTEFIAASIDGCGAITEEVCRTAFSLFDRDGDGQISASELTEVLDKGRVRAASSELMCKVDSNNDGQINFQEFIRMMGISPDKTPSSAARRGGA